MFSPSLLRNRTALVTGASRGLGLGISRALAAAGTARIVLVARGSTALDAAAAELQAAFPRTQTHAVAGDVRDRAFWEGAATDALLAASGSLEGGEAEADAAAAAGASTILVNAAGIAQAGLLARAGEREIRDVYETNLLGATWGCQAFARAVMKLKRQQRWRERERKLGPRAAGCIVNVGSLLGARGGVGASAYAASKAGLLGLTRALAAELGPAGIRVNAVVPGYVDTDMTAALDPKLREAHVAATPLRCIGQPGDIASAAVFLAANEFANNCVVNLDGGLSAMSIVAGSLGIISLHQA